MKAAILVFLMLGIAIGGTAMIFELPLEELTVGADIIAIGTVREANNTTQAAPGSKVANALVITDVLKGEKPAGGALDVETIAGFEDSPTFDPSRKYIVFLKKIGNGRYEPVNFVQGVWPVAETGAFEGMGTFTTRDQLTAAIAATRGRKPAPIAPNASGAAPLD